MIQRDEGDLANEFFRPDLRAIGLVLVRPGRQETDTLWCDPDVHPEPLLDMAAEAGQAIAALLLVCERDVTAYVQPKWRATAWFTRYVESVTQAIHGRGLDAFLGTVSLRIPEGTTTTGAGALGN